MNDMLKPGNKDGWDEAPAPRELSEAIRQRSEQPIEIEAGESSGRAFSWMVKSKCCRRTQATRKGFSKE